jgi:ssDNA thymidine ADP-ribosyltransferase, DarT
MAKTIQEFVAERGIKLLMHFTRAKNLPSILARGLVPRSTLALEGFEDFNDRYRIDGTDAVCLSIDFPNYKMFYGIQKDYPGEKWVVLCIHAQALWDLDCGFCTANAASNGVTAIPLEDRKTLAAMQAMYADWPDKPPRSALNLPSNYPTNPQAEVLALQGVPRKYILGVLTLNDAVRQELMATHPGVEFRANARYFRYRQDFAAWKG